MGSKVYVSAAAMHLMQAETDFVTEAILTSVLKNQKFPQLFLQNLFGGHAGKIPAMQKYGRDIYELGLPSGYTTTVGAITDADLADIIEIDTGYPYNTSIINKNNQILDAFVVMADWLCQNRGYVSDDNLITVRPGGYTFGQVYQSGSPLTHIAEKVIVASIVEEDDNTNVIITYNNVALVSWFVAGDPGYYEDRWIATDSPVQTEIQAMPLTGDNYAWGVDVILAFYTKYDSGGAPIAGENAWWYAYADGTYSELTQDASTLPKDEFLPVVPLRYNNVDFTNEDQTISGDRSSPSHPQHNLWLTSERLLKKVGMDIGQLGKTINENPDITEMDHAYVLFGVDLQSNFSSSALYLNNYFFALESELGAGSYNYRAANSGWFSGTRWYPPQADGFVEYGLDLNFGHQGITITYENGSIDNGRNGKAEMFIESYTYTYTVYDDEDGQPSTATATAYRLITRAQIGVNLIRRVEIDRMYCWNNIYSDRYEYTDLETLYLDTEKENHNFIIPIQYTLSQDIPYLYRSELYSDCSLLLVNTYQIIKTKWYETGFFKFVLLVVAVVVAVYSGQYWIAAAVAAAEAGVLAIILLLVQTVLFAIVVNVAMDWLVKELGTDFALILAVIAFVAAAITGDITLLGGQFSLTSSQLLGMMSFALVESSNKFLINERAQIENEYADFSDRLEDRYEELKTVEDLLERNHDIDPLTFASPRKLKMIPTQNPDHFFSRCLGLPSYNTYGIHTEIPNYVDIRLKLPQGVPTDIYRANLQA